MLNIPKTGLTLYAFVIVLELELTGRAKALHRSVQSPRQKDYKSQHSTSDGIRVR